MATFAMVGVPSERRAALEAAFPLSGIDGELAVVTDLHALTERPVAIFVGAEAVGGDVVPMLRRSFPGSALVSVADTPDEGFDDVVGAGEWEAPILARVFRSASVVGRTLGEVVQWALRDPLTGLLDRRGVERALARETSERDRGQGALTALLVDCDDFKRVNDNFGLAAGDEALRALAGAMSGALRLGDTVARIGGDEFLVLLPHTRTWEAVEVAERIRQRIRETVATPGGDALTVSIAVRRLDTRVQSLADVIGAAQGGLKQSKNAGKDQVRVVEGVHSSAPISTSRAEASLFDSGASLPPGEHLFSFRHEFGVDLRTGRRALRVVRARLSTQREAEVSTQRASHSTWDLIWFQSAIRSAARAEEIVHVEIFPATLLEVPTKRVLGSLPAKFPPQHLTLCIDEQSMTGDPSALLPKLDPLRSAGVSACVLASDLGPSCLEALCLLRPERVMLSGVLAVGVAANRSRQAALRRFVRVCDSLGVGVLATGIEQEADRAALQDAGVRFGAGAAVPGSELAEESLPS